MQNNFASLLFFVVSDSEEVTLDIPVNRCKEGGAQSAQFAKGNI